MQAMPHEVDTYERLSAQDATFLYLEGPDTPYHVASLMRFEGEADAETFSAVLASRLHRLPRFRQKLAFVPFNTARPVWADDPHFDLGYHVRTATVGRPGDLRALEHTCGELMAQHLDRARPLWEMYVIDGLSDGTFAVFTKTHHCMVDGVAGIDAMTLVLDPSPDTPDEQPEPWTPGPWPSPTRLLRDAALEGARQPLRIARRAARLLRHPDEALRDVSMVVHEVEELGHEARHPAPATPLNGPVGPNRAVRFVSVPLEDLRNIGHRAGGTVNDAVLAVVAGALRRWLLARNIPVEDLEVRAMVPVSTRSAGAQEVGNAVTGLIAPLPVGVPDPAVRLHIVHEAMRKAKQSPQAGGAEHLIELTGAFSPAVMSRLAVLQHRQRVANLVVTNIPGPTEPLYAAGRRLLDVYPLTPLGGGMGLVVALVSYAGQMEFGLVADAEAVPDLDVIAQGLTRSVRELRPARRRRRSA